MVISNLKESEVQVTFRDIMIDYYNYKRAYYNHKAFESPRDQYKAQEIPVDLDNFTIWGTIKHILTHAESYPKASIPAMFVYLAMISFIFVFWRMIRTPIEWY